MDRRRGHSLFQSFVTLEANSCCFCAVPGARMLKLLDMLNMSNLEVLPVFSVLH